MRLSRASWWLMLALAPAAEGAELLHEVESRLEHARVTRGEFVEEKRLVGVGRPLKGRGSFLVDRERGVLWRTLAPFPSVLKITRGEIVQTDGKQVLMRLAAEREPAVKAVSAVLFATFAADLGALAQYFDFAGGVDGGRWHLKLTPKEPGLARVIRVLELDGAQSVRHVDLTATSGDLLHLEFRQVESAGAPTAAETAELD